VRRDEFDGLHVPACTGFNNGIPHVKLLAIDTVTEACSAALLVDGEISQRFTIEPRRHTELILPMVYELLADAGLSLGQLDALAVDRGPGSFTGVRIGIGVVQGLAFAVDQPVFPVSSLATLALAACQKDCDHTVLAMLDARMQEVYWSTYNVKQGMLQSHMDEQVGQLETLPKLPGKILCVGTGARLLAATQHSYENYDFIQDSTFDYPHALHVVQLASQYSPEKAVSATQLQPVYLRNQVVQSQQS
jgi:tRNA threonylcarbamoyladenosine biosynthesis protein TsaB